MTGSEGGHEDIDTSVVGLILRVVSVDDFERVIVGESDLTNVVEGVGDQGKELMRGGWLQWWVCGDFHQTCPRSCSA